MPISRTYETFKLVKDGVDHICNKHQAQELVDSEQGYVDPTGEFQNAKQVEAQKKAEAEAAEKARLEAEAEEKRQADALAEQERKDKAKDDEIAELKRQLAEKNQPESGEAKPAVKRGGKRPAPKSSKPEEGASTEGAAETSQEPAASAAS